MMASLGLSYPFIESSVLVGLKLDRGLLQGGWGPQALVHLNVFPTLPPSYPIGLGSGWRGSSRYKCAWKLNLWLFFFFLSTLVSLILISAVTPNVATGQQLPSSLLPRPSRGSPHLYRRPVLALPTFRRPKILLWPARASEGPPLQSWRFG